MPVILGIKLFKGDHNILRFKLYTCIKFMKIRHDILIQCCGNHMLKEIDILRYSSQKYLVVLRGAFEGSGCPKDAQAPCWLKTI